MESPITIIIPTHNRSHYLNRAINYYKKFKYPIIVLDSSHQAFKLDSNSSVGYYHLPAMSLPDKLYFGFTIIKTEFVVMCADDDFLVSDGIDECINFLQQNRQYAVADGSVLSYKKHDIFRSRINFSLVYKTNLDASFESKNALDRIDIFFKNFRTVFYGIHYTKNLLEAYEKCRNSFINLFLNEYLSAIIPISIGYCKIIPKIVLIREYTDESGDKITPTLKKMFADINGNKELDQYISCVAKTILPYTDATLQKCVTTLENILKAYALQISIDEQKAYNQSQSMVKKIGKIFLKIPVVGVGIVQKRRLQESKKQIEQVIKTKSDFDNIKHIETCILDFPLID